MDEKKLIQKGEQPFAKISCEKLKFLIAREFPNDTNIVYRKLDKIETTNLDGKYRISAAVLKLTDKDLDKIDYYINIALEDFRDVISMAEYPRASNNFGNRSKEENKSDYLKDWEEYSSWLNKTI